ncbi:MAG: hypothetical protein ACREFQ_20830 [Stellaceae bacterium]
MTQDYRFYFMLGQSILAGEDRSAADDEAASQAAEQALAAADPAFDAIEVWRGTARIARHERAPPQHRP